MRSLPRLPRVRAPMRNGAVQILRESIANRLLRPGTPLSERELASMLGISRATLREALRELEAEGLLERDSKGRLIVSSFDEVMVKAIYEVREHLEGLAAALCAQRASDEEVEGLMAILEGLEQAVAERNSSRYLLLKDQFYASLLAAARNPVLESLLKSVQWRFRFLRATSLQVPGRLEVSLAEMRDIVDAIRLREPEVAEQRSRHHIRNAAAAALQALAEYSPSLAEGTVCEV